MSRPIRTRLAPTPSGYLHAGNALNFVLTWMESRRRGGSVRLRMDDLDAERVRDVYVEDVFRSLDWLKLDWDEGPFSPGELATHSQTRRLDRYLDVLKRLEAKPGSVFVCRCSRAEIRVKALDGRYPGTCRDKMLPWRIGESALRLRSPDDASSAWNDLYAGPLEVNLDGSMHDFVLRRRDGIPSYQLASLTDDLDQDINLIVRGLDLAGSTAAQLLLARRLDAQKFTQVIFAHHPLLLNPAGDKLSKSAGSTSLAVLREAWPDASPFFRWMAHFLGLPADTVRDARTLLAAYDRMHPLDAAGNVSDIPRALSLGPGESCDSARRWFAPTPDAPAPAPEAKNSRP